jgi:hypothetical protein
MKENIKQIIRELSQGDLIGGELEDKESILLQELRCSNDTSEIKEICSALTKSGTILAVPSLFALIKGSGPTLKHLFEEAVIGIARRAKARGSLLPGQYYTPEHWRPQWQGSKKKFLSYVNVLADIHQKNDENEAEVNRIGEILAKEMQIDISPYTSFKDFKVCINGWDFKEDYKIVLDRMEQERVIAAVEDAGIGESWETFLTDHLNDLKYDYLLTRLKMGDNFAYHQFVLKMAECLNIKD